MTQPAAPPQLSPDGQWWWNGTEWVPAAARPALPEQPEQPEPSPTPVLSGYAPPVTITPSVPPTYTTAPYAAAPSGHDGLAIASLVLSLLWLMGLGSVGAIVTGHLSRSKAKREGRQPSGMALAGVVIGYVGAAFMVLGILAAIAIPVFLDQRVKADRADVKSSLRSLAVAEEAYQVDHGAYTEDLSALEAGGYAPDGAVQVRIFRADEGGYCLGAHQDTTTYYYRSGSGIGTEPCS